MTPFPLLLVLLVALGSGSGFKVAVYEHVPVLPPDSLRDVTRARARQNLDLNMKTYKEQAEAAAKQGVQLLVFPDGGLFGLTFTRTSIGPYTEQVPDPRVYTWVPCDEPGKYGISYIQTFLSCLAKNNSLYVVANMADRQPCIGYFCTGFSQYNTDVVFNPKGQLVARYHKRHLFFESQFDTPPVELITFDTPMGKFGLVICFDLLFKSPFLDLIETQGVTSLVAPNAWMLGFPHLTAVNYAGSLARGLGVNLLTANLHIPSYSFGGSGIFTPAGAAAYYFDSTMHSGGKLLVADIDAVPHPRNIHAEVVNSIPSNVAPEPSSGTFHSFINKDLYTFVKLTGASGEKQVCHGTACCYLRYKRSGISETFVLGAFSGYNTNAARYAFQSCLLVKCKSKETSSCGQTTETSSTLFPELQLLAKLDQRAVMYPQVAISTGSGKMGLAPGQWNFEYSRAEVKAENLTSPLLSASIFARIYEMDSSDTSVIG